MKSRIALKSCVIDLRLLRVLRDDRTESLTAMEARLLAYLMSHRNRVVSHEELLREVWEYSSRSSTQTVRMTVGRLRAKIEVDAAKPDHLCTVVRQGYRWELDDDGLDDLPPSKSPFVGRDSVFEALHQALLTPGCVTILGPAGAGKTRLVAEYLRSGLFDGQTLFCDLSPCLTEDDFIRAVASALRAPLSGDREPTAQLGRLLASLEPAILALDNFEQLVHATPVVDDWLKAAPDLRVLVTSQHRLPLARAQVIELGPLDPGDAAALFGQLSEGADIEATAVARIVERLDHLPLAIELAAPWASVMNGEQLEARLRDRFRLLKTDDSDVAARHRTLRAALDQSWVLLEPDEQQALAECAVFLGIFTLEDAERVLTDVGDRAVFERVRTLQEKSLISKDGEGLRLLDSTRQYVADRVSSAVRTRHEAYMVERAETLADSLGGGDPAAAQRDFVSLMPNLLAALEWASDPSHAQRIVVALGGLFAIRGPAALHIQLLEGVLASSPHDPVAVQRELGEAMRRGGRVGESRDLLRSLDIEGLDPTLGARVRISLGMALMYLRDGGRPEFEEAVALARKPPVDQRLLGLAERALASALRMDGELDAAISALQRAVALQEQGDFAMELTLSLLDIGEIQSLQRQAISARHYLTRALRLARKCENLRAEQLSSHRIGESHLYEGDLAQAEDWFRQTLVLSRRLGYRRAEAQALWRLGTVLQLRFESVEAEEALIEAEQIYIALGNDFGRSLVREIRAIVALQMGEYARGIEMMEGNIADMRARNAEMTLGSSLQFLGLARWLAGDLDGAKAALEDSIRTLLAMGRDTSAACSRVWLAALIAPAAPDEAIELLRLGKPVLQVGSSEDRGLCWRVEASVARHADWEAPPGPAPEFEEDSWMLDRLLGPVA